MHSRYLLLLFVILIAKAAAVLFAVLYAGIGLGPDEAQYWTWSQYLDWGYYSKPPGIAWEIWAGTSLFGNTELGVRTVPNAFGFIMPLMVYCLGQQSKLSPKASFWSALAFAFAPLGILASFLAITDTGMILAWTAACAHVAGRLAHEKPLNFILIGLLIFVGALFKWTMFIFWIAVIACIIFNPKMRSFDSLQRLCRGFFISLAALLPSVYWNAQHDWPTFRHVSSTLTGGHGIQKAGALIHGNPVEFVGSQAALISPILFILLILAWGFIFRNRKDVPNSILFCGFVSLVVFTAGLLASFLMKMQGNWIIFAYPTAFVLIGWYGVDVACQAKKWLIAGVALSALLNVGVFSLPTIQSKGVISNVEIPYRISPFRHNVGWNQLSKALVDVGYDPNVDFLFSDKYQTTSILSFYGPEQKRAYFLNLGGVRRNQFSYWPSMADEMRGKNGFFVLVENIPQMSDSTIPEKYIKLLKPYFDEVHYIGLKPLFESYGKATKGAFLFHGQVYNGNMSSDPDLY